MNTFKELFAAILRVVFGNNTVDNAKEWKMAHDKASASRREVEKIIEESKKS